MEFSIVGFLVFAGLFLFALHRVIASAVREGIESSRLFPENRQDDLEED